MPLPDIQDICKPILEVLRDRDPHNLAINDLMNIAAEHFGLGELSTNDRNTFKQTVTQAKNDLKNKKLIANPSNNTYIITSAGLNYLNESQNESEKTEQTAIIPEESESPEEMQDIHEPEDFEEIAEVPELVELSDELPDIPDEPEDISENAQQEVQSEHDDIELEDEPDDISENTQPVQEVQQAHDDIELEDEPDDIPEESQEESQEPAAELSQPDMTEEPDTHEHKEMPAEGEDIAESPEPEYESESQELNENEVNNMNNMNEDKSIGIENAIRIHNEELAEQVLSRMSELPAETFEVFVIDLLSKMGYRAFQNARYTSDEAGSDLIHGVIIDDKTASAIYIHAHKSSPEKTIGRADMQDFIDALSDKGGKGIFATTAKFSEQAEVLANDERIMLIDGLKLASLMIAHNFCVKVERVYEIKEFDTESFSDYQR